jgi:hypothetical protein
VRSGAHPRLKISPANGQAGSRKVVQEIYENTVRYFRAQLTEDECNKIWLHDQTGMTGVQEAVRAAKAKYEGESEHSKARKWLKRMSQSILLYGKVLEMSASYCPEYVELPLGAIKFLLTVGFGHVPLVLKSIGS